jgi:S-adenosylmethionine hydrolase
VFVTDFGVKDDSVALCKGVMWRIAPGLRIVDLTHDVTPFDVREAGRVIAGAAPYFPKAVFVAVVDPGVGSARRAVAVLSKAGRIYVGPDNGVFTQVLDAEGVAEAREIANPRFLLPDPSSTFHGRDVFAPAGAYLADNAPLSEVGPEVSDLVRGPAPDPPAAADGWVTGEVDFVELPFGNVITNVPRAFLEREAGVRPGDFLDVSFDGAAPLRLPYRRTFSDVPEGGELALPSSRGLLSFSVNLGDFAARRGVKEGAGVRVRKAAAP